MPMAMRFLPLVLTGSLLVRKGGAGWERGAPLDAALAETAGQFARGCGGRPPPRVTPHVRASHGEGPGWG